MEHMFYETIVRNLPREESLKHHLKIYNGNIPFWMLVEHLTLGNISSFVNYLDRSWRKDWIDEKMKLDDGELICGPRQIPEWINSLRILRNVCAHMGRLYTRTFPFRVNFDKVKTIGSLELNSNKFKQSIFCALFIIRRFYLFLSVERRTEWNIFVEKLANKIESFHIDISQRSQEGVETFNIEEWIIE